MGWDFIISISSLIGAAALGLILAVSNNKRFKETQELRLAAYRLKKAQKNEALRRQLESRESG